MSSAPNEEPSVLAPQFRGRLGKVRLGFKVLETLGWRWVATRLFLTTEHKLGVYKRRSPMSTWQNLDVGPSQAFRWLTLYNSDAGQFLRDEVPEAEADLRRTLDQLKNRQFDVFGTMCDIDSWHHEPITPASYPIGQHWSEVRELPEADLKLIWEPSRFGWAFKLARLHAFDPETAAPDVFWQLFEDWCDANQPNDGVNWTCGQESALRLMAAVFAVQAFGPDYLTPGRRTLLAKFADVTAQRISAHWRYARSQDNNHIVSEAVGLITVGLLFPDLARAARYRRLGERLLVQACEKLVFADGGTSQYSLNYHRVFMENFIWAMWLFRSVGKAVPDELESALDRTYRFLLAITQKSDGAAGNWGNNDGAHILPLTSTRHLDVRPTLLMAAQLIEGSTYDWGGPAIEAVCWFWGRPQRYLPNEPEPEGVQTKVFPDAGLSVIVNGKHRALIRGGEHQLFRPPQCDFGHVELWVDGEQVVFDPGTWSYKPKPGEPDLSETQHHNMPHIPGEQQMTRLGRFLWGDWPKVSISTVDHFSVSAHGKELEFERSVTPSANGWEIEDLSKNVAFWEWATSSQTEAGDTLSTCSYRSETISPHPSPKVDQVTHFTANARRWTITGQG